MKLVICEFLVTREFYLIYVSKNFTHWRRKFICAMLGGYALRKNYVYSRFLCLLTKKALMKYGDVIAYKRHCHVGAHVGFVTGIPGSFHLTLT